MTKEELEKEAGNWLRKYLLCCNCEKKCNCIDSNSYCEEQVLKAYVDSAEPREKQIQIDAEQIRALQKQNGELTDKVRELEEKLEQTEKDLADYQFNYPTIKELEAQIEKMKCCKEEIIKSLKETLDYEWLHAHNGKAKYLYLQTVIDIVNEKFEEIKEK